MSDEQQHDLFRGPAIDRSTCLWCGDEATHLCDFHVGRRPTDTTEEDGMLGYDVWTCDAPMCRECAELLFVMCDRSSGGCEPHTTDVCPVHAECDEMLGFRADEGQVFTEREIRKWRMVFYRRQRMEARSG